MQNLSATQKIEALLQGYGNHLFRLCLVILGNESDAEDAVQETLIKYLQKAPAFTNISHEKAWLIKVASNTCRDMLRYRQRHLQTDTDALQYMPAVSENPEILEALMKLPEKFKLVLVLYYVEGYRINEIAEIINKTPSAVKMRLQKGRKLLEQIYRKEYL